MNIFSAQLLWRLIAQKIFSYKKHTSLSAVKITQKSYTINLQKQPAILQQEIDGKDGPDIILSA